MTVEVIRIKVRRAYKKDKRKGKAGTGGLAVTIPYKIRSLLGIKQNDILLFVHNTNTKSTRIYTKEQYFKGVKI